MKIIKLLLSEVKLFNLVGNPEEHIQGFNVSQYYF